MEQLYNPISAVDLGKMYYLPRWFFLSGFLMLIGFQFLIDLGVDRENPLVYLILLFLQFGCLGITVWLVRALYLTYSSSSLQLKLAATKYTSSADYYSKYYGDYEREISKREQDLKKRVAKLTREIKSIERKQEQTRADKRRFDAARDERYENEATLNNIAELVARVETHNRLSTDLHSEAFEAEDTLMRQLKTLLYAGLVVLLGFMIFALFQNLRTPQIVDGEPLRVLQHLVILINFAFRGSILAILELFSLDEYILFANVAGFEMNDATFGFRANAWICRSFFALLLSALVLEFLRIAFLKRIRTMG